MNDNQYLLIKSKIFSHNITLFRCFKFYWKTFLNSGKKSWQYSSNKIDHEIKKKAIKIANIELGSRTFK